jgi:hypothetical protein
MADLDVSDVLLDPDFMTMDLVCKRLAVAVGNNGRSNKSEQSFQFSGVVTTNNGQNMDRREDGTLIKRCDQYPHPDKINRRRCKQPSR